MVDKFTQPIFTAEGKAALANGISAQKKFGLIQIKTFDAKQTASVTFKNLGNAKQTLAVGTVTTADDTVIVRLQISNKGLAKEYNLQGIALIGNDGMNDFVLSIINANENITISAFSGSEQTISINLSLVLDDSSVITVNAQTAGMLTVDDYIDLKNQIDTKPVDTTVVHKTASEVIDGFKTFSKKILALGGLVGNADTATKAETAKKLAIERKISLFGGASGSAKFDGSSDLVIEVSSLDSTLQKAKQVVDNTDLDNLLSSGMYVTSGKQISNTPIAGTSYATIIVVENQTNSKNNSMIYQDTNTNRIWIRQRKSAIWQPWYELFKQGDRFQGDLFVAAPDGKTARIALIDDNNTGNTGLIRYSGLDVTGNPYQGITVLSDNGNLVLGGGEGATELARALSTGFGLGTLGTYGVNANGERTMVGGDGGVLIIPNLSSFQTGVSGTPEDAIFWDFKPNGTVRTPSGNLLQEVDNATTRSYGLGQLFDPATYLTFVRSGKVVSVYGQLKTIRDVTDLKTYQNENLIPVGYRPFAEFKSTISHNASDGSKKVRGDVAYNGAGNVSIDDITIGGNADMNGIVPAGTILTFTATWVMA